MSDDETEIFSLSLYGDTVEPAGDFPQLSTDAMQRLGIAMARMHFSQGRILGGTVVRIEVHYSVDGTRCEIHITPSLGSKQILRFPE